MPSAQPYRRAVRDETSNLLGGVRRRFAIVFSIYDQHGHANFAQLLFLMIVHREFEHLSQTALRRRGMKTILKYGIAFWEKECQVVLKS